MNYSDDNMTNNESDVLELFAKFDEEYLLLKKQFQNVIENYQREIAVLNDDVESLTQTVKHYKNEAEKARGRVQPRAIMEAVLPSITSIANAVTDADDLEKLKKSVALHLEKLYDSLDLVGIEITHHERGDTIEYGEETDLTSVKTPDVEKNRKVQRSTRFGCRIDGEINPILERINLYIYDESLDEETGEIVNDAVGATKTSMSENPQTESNTPTPESESSDTNFRTSENHKTYGKICQSGEKRFIEILVPINCISYRDDCQMNSTMYSEHSTFIIGEEYELPSELAPGMSNTSYFGIHKLSSADSQSRRHCFSFSEDSDNGIQLNIYLDGNNDCTVSRIKFKLSQNMYLIMEED